MKFLDKEYHPVIENYIADYAEDNLELVERDTFEEVLVHDDDLRELAFSAKEGKKLLSMLQEVKAKEGFLERLNDRIAQSEN
ncbi:hypothetical protein A8B79_13050 [Balneola sp. EhC07]|jgi:hypothetical protein|uniref:hypothetical protein n=1 Tax=Balneola sp. EhC07 TaxID=1849360 RepID=UPI0007F5317E|nr:hypothetical protein [Balneola sp. EhC07]OAN64266.1 hypothetical protein A8B79_13050 [Balneola sp. EhC07]